MEIIIAIIIIGFLAAMALPRYGSTVDRTQSAEGIQILEALVSAQNLYYFENNSFASDINDLDITIPTPTNFSAPSVSSSDPVASITHISPNTYTIEMDADGTVDCQDGGAPSGFCTKLGLP